LALSSLSNVQTEKLVLGQLDCGGSFEVEPTRRNILSPMDPLEKCMLRLRVLNASGDDGGIVSAENAVNEYLQSFPTPAAPSWRTASPAGRLNSAGVIWRPSNIYQYGARIH
jgi:hypothetical protein